MRKVLITGVSGFAGSHLVELLLGTEGVEISGLHLEDNIANIAEYAERIELVKCDLLDAARVAEVVANTRPDQIYHLAAQSIPALSVKDPAPTLRINIFATLNILEAVRKHCADAVVVNIGSCEEYGEADPSAMPVKENAELKPCNPYAVSKVTQDLLGYQYWKSMGVKVVRCRPFNHFGPRQSDIFVASSFARQVAGIEAGLTADNVIRVGNLEPERDFLDVRDVVTAYVLLAEKGVPGEAYNICSGAPVSIQKLLDTLVALSRVKVEVERDPARMRPNDVPVVYGDATKLKSLGWEPAHTLESALERLLDYWRSVVSARA